MRSELDISHLQWPTITDANDSDRSRLNLFERRLVQSHATVVIPLDNRVLFVSSLHCAEFSSRPSEVAQTLDPISGSQLLAGGGGLGEGWPLGTVSVGDRPGVGQGWLGCFPQFRYRLIGSMDHVRCLFPMRAREVPFGGAV
jgi:hypothetical protein